MRRRISPREQLQSYLDGWLEGSSGGEYPLPVGQSPEYILGYNDGANAYIEARAVAMERLDIQDRQDT